MFEGFSKETSEFLWELSFNNERPWFLAHREQFERCLNAPFKALAAETAARMAARFPDRAWDSHCSRIYRDARRLFGRGPYKDHLWFVLSPEGNSKVGPAFWFELSAADWEYGVGLFDATPTVMETFRRTVDANPARFERLAADAARMRGLKVFGPEYKKPKGDYPEPIGSWYNRRYLACSRKQDFGGALLTPQLPETLARAYTRLMPLYEFFFEVYRAAAEAEEKKER